MTFFTFFKKNVLFFLVLTASCFVVNHLQAQVSGNVFKDYNGDGLKTQLPNLDEPGLAGIIINVYDSDNDIIASYISDGDGNYSIPSSGGAFDGNIGSSTGFVPSGFPVRVEFVIPEAMEELCGLASNAEYSSYNGSQYGTSVQFVNGGADQIDFAIHTPGEYRHVELPTIFIPCYVNGDPLAGGDSGTSEWFVSFPYTNSGTQMPTDKLNGQVLGSVYGVAFSRQAQKVFTSAFLKRHVGMGQLGTGGIYLIGYNEDETFGSITNFYDLDANGWPTRYDQGKGMIEYGNGTSFSVENGPMGTEEIDYLGDIDDASGYPAGLGVVGTNVERGLSPSKSDDSYDPAAFDQVGKVGLGDLAISDDGRYLFVTNLYTRKILRMELDNPFNPTAIVSIEEFSIPDINCNNGVLRPFGLRYYRGNLYVGTVCSGEDGGVNNIEGATDLYAQVAVLESASKDTPDWASELLVDFPLNYRKGTSYTLGGCGQSSRWKPWTNTFQTICTGNLDRLVYEQPVLSDIGFADDGSVILAFMDRMGHQAGGGNVDLVEPSSGNNENGRWYVSTGGDLLKVFIDEDQPCIYRVENASDRTPQQNNNQGPDGGEFFLNDDFDNHHETAQGAILIVPGISEVVSTVMDPIAINSGGLRWLNTEDGTVNKNYQLYSGVGDVGLLGKANGLGAMDVAEEAAKLEIGNRVWLDINENGVQDANESGIDGVVLELYLNDIKVGETTTSNGGQYYFNEDNVNLNGASALVPLTAYEIRVPSGQSELEGLELTVANADSGELSEVRDSDAEMLQGLPTIVYTTGGDGQNDHTLDIGFLPAMSCPDLTGTPDNVTIDDSVCDDCTISGGEITPPADPCPEGSNIQYSVDNGATWTSVVPEYDLTESITIITRCQCISDESEVSPTSDPVTTNPGVCPVVCDCPDLTDAPENVTIDDSVCDNCLVSGGEIIAPVDPCPDGSNIQYSVDNGATWSSTVPAYDFSEPITIITRCQCIEEESEVSPSSSPITTNPGVCPPGCDCPDLDGPPSNVDIINSNCNDCILTPGLIIEPTSPCPAGSIIEYSTNGGVTWTNTVPVYDENNSITIVTRCRCGSDASIFSPSSDPVTTDPQSCPPVCDCPDDLPTPGNVIIVDSECMDCELTPGVISEPDDACPDGSNLQYSTDGGATWVSDLPLYDQENSISIITRCQCISDPDLVSDTSDPIATNPGECPSICDAFCDLTIDEVEASPCDPLTSTYSLSVTLTYSISSNAILTINGTDFNVSEGENITDTFVLEGLDADGETGKSVAVLLNGETECSAEIANAYDAPEACEPSCPEDYSITESDMTLDALMTYTVPICLEAMEVTVELEIDNPCDGFFSLSNLDPDFGGLDFEVSDSGVDYVQYVVTVVPGNYTWTFSYTNPTGEIISTSIDVTVEEEPNAPAIITMPGVTQFTQSYCAEVMEVFEIVMIDDCDEPINPDNASFTLCEAPLNYDEFDAATGTFTFMVPVRVEIDQCNITAAYTDPDGNESFGTSTITVNGIQDEIPPVVVYPSQNINVEIGECVEANQACFYVTAIDDCDGILIPIVMIDGEIIEPLIGTNTYCVDFTEGGDYYVLIEVEDSNGNVRQEDFTISVTEEVSPEANLACISNLNISLNADCEAIVTPSMLLNGSFGCLTEDDFRITLNGVETNLLTECGEVEYMIEQVAPEPITGFVGPFSSSNWTLLEESNGTVTFSADNQSVTLVGPDGGFCPGGAESSMTIVITENGTITFDWDWTNPDPNFDFFVVTVDQGGVINTLVDTGAATANGSVNVLVSEGNTLLIGVESIDCLFGTGTAVVNNFVFNPVAQDIALEACWGNILVEDKRKPTIGVDCMQPSGDGLIGVYVLNGISNGLTFDYEDCLEGITGVPAPGNTTGITVATATLTVSESGDYFIDFANNADIAEEGGFFPGNGNDFFLSFNNVGLLVQGDWDPANPCDNVITGASTGSTTAPPGDISPAFVANLQAGQTYTLVSYAASGFVLPPTGFENVIFTASVVNLDQCIIGNIGCTEIDQLLNATTFEDLEALGITIPTFSDNCGISESGFVVGNVNINDFCEDRFVDITFTARDICGNEADELTVLVEIDNDALATICDDLENWDGIQNPVFLCDGNWIADSNGNPSPSITGQPENQSCNIQCSYSDINIPLCGDGSSSRKVLRTWTCVDWCLPNDQVQECHQIIKVADMTGPSIEVNELAMEEPDYYDCFYNIRFNAPTVTDNCSDIVRVSISGPGFSGDFINVANNINNATFPRNIQPGLQEPLELPTGTHTIIYEAEDACGNVTVLETILTLSDQVAPIAVCEKFRVASLGGECRVRIFADAFDDGSYDNCPDITYSVARMRPSICYAIPEFGTPVNSARALDFRGFVDFCCDDVEASVDQRTVVFRVTDAAGNTNECMVEVEVQDKLRPTVTCPPDMTVDCRLHFGNGDDELADLFGTIVPLGADRRSVPEVDPFRGPYLSINGDLLDGEASDNCYQTDQGCDVDIQVVNSISIDECRTGTIARIFTVTDRAGNTARCTQIISVVNLFPFDADFFRVYRQIPGTNSYAQYPNGPYENQIPFQPGVTGQARLNLRPASTTYPSRFDIVWPADLEVDFCGEDIQPEALQDNPALIVGSYPRLEREDFCAQIGMTFDEWDFDFDAGCKKVVRLWKVIDWCQESTVLDPWMWEQIIKVTDTEPPFISAGPYEFCITAEICDPEPVFEITAFAMDNCASRDEIRWDWEVYPFGDRSQPITRSSFPGENPNFWPRGEQITIARRWPRTPDNGPAHIIKFVAEDGCGNKRVEEVPFRIRDCKKPTPICHDGLAVDLMPTSAMVSVQAVFWNAGSYDNCTAQEDLIYRIERAEGADGQTVPTSTNIIFDCEDIGEVIVNMWVGDEYGNWDYCQTYIDVQNNMDADCPDENTQVTGIVLTEDAYGVEFVEVGSIFTNELGEFNIEVIEGEDLMLNPRRLDNPRNGVTVSDILAISQHVLGIEQLDSPFKLLAADVNNDQRVSATDLVDIRSLILGRVDAFPSVDSWQFIYLENEYPDDEDPFNGTWPSSVHIPYHEITSDPINFVGVKMGDVNNTVVGNSNMLQPVVSRSNPVKFIVDDIEIVDGNQYEIPFFMDNSSGTIKGFQYTLTFEEGLLFNDFEAKGIELSADNFSMRGLDEGMITSAWTSVDGLVIEEDQALFVLRFTARADGQLSQMIDINSLFTEAIAIRNGEEVLLDIDFRSGNGPGLGGFTYELYQNKPNPFGNETLIGFSLPKSMAATLTIYDMTGRQIKLIEGDFAKGINNVMISRNDLPAAGVLYYQLEAGEFRATKKMVLIE